MRPLDVWEQWRRIASEVLLMLGSLLTLISMSSSDIAAFLPDKRVGAVLLVCGFLDKIYVKWRAMRKSAEGGDTP